METESLSDTKDGMKRQLSDIIETWKVAQKYMHICTLHFF